ncbi:MAG: hypothetical protein R3277_12175 [Brumimicrobium sp.]|nr:hypothetical protein [Brumimicrobium sp.]
MPGLKFRVLLDSIKEGDVFCDIVINDDNSFEKLYTEILEAFDFPNDQMASFFVSNAEWDKGEEISLMDMTFGPSEGEDVPQQMSELMIRERIQSPNQRFILVYDFLNMWIFLIELQEILSEEISTPKVVMKVGEIPDKLRKEGTNSLQNMRFDTKKSDDSSDFGYDDFDDDLDSDSFENIDDYDF